jgi:hypothetical protein
VDKFVRGKYLFFNTKETDLDGWKGTRDAERGAAGEVPATAAAGVAPDPVVDTPEQGGQVLRRQPAPQAAACRRVWAPAPAQGCWQHGDRIGRREWQPRGRRLEGFSEKDCVCGAAAECDLAEDPVHVLPAAGERARGLAQRARHAIAGARAGPGVPRAPEDQHVRDKRAE